MSAARLSVVTAVAVAAALTALSGCAEKKTDAKASDAVQVTATDEECKVSKTSFPAGHVSFAFENKGSKANELYVYAPGDKIMTERENIGPGTKADISTELKAGEYEVTCKPGMKGAGLRTKITVTGANAPKKTDPRLATAVAEYRQYAQSEADATLPKVKVFAEAVKRGDLEAAKAAYAPSRVGWETTEPIAEAFGDIDPKTDVRQDSVQAGQKWTGWHRLEKSLWQDKKIGAEEKTLADQLVTDLTDWQTRIGKADITPTGMANGAKSLMDEVANNKITGEEERYSHTDLVDFKGNLDGAQKSYVLLKPVVAQNDAALAKELDKQFAALTTLLGKYRTGDTYVSYDTVNAAQRKELSDGVNALAEPLSKLAATVAK
ncbi:peptidase M75 family protein [Streptomyces sp. H10-C2]|uniref:iron uptake system protein EfeO n=1 Tax=unclassified Streptomyces TaxID=2593676 RepID=UPI0024BA3D67|nr:MULTISPECIES: iron uptake system protein EfeO [unclassified Streptomyces]MDJ0346408.1 peptidase M75 family protein [Streptomyces sp. PH10-H1]MDJ0374171.1 peptidase M75 family protein [Streptomyces sp. H10-C2]